MNFILYFWITNIFNLYDHKRYKDIFVHHRNDSIKRDKLHEWYTRLVAYPKIDRNTMSRDCKWPLDFIELDSGQAISSIHETRRNSEDLKAAEW